MKKKHLLLTTLLILSLLLTACGAQSAPMEDSAAAEMPMTEEALPEPESEPEFNTSAQETPSEDLTVEEVAQYSDKIIYSGNLYMETTRFDETLNALDQAVKKLGGFVQDSSVNGDARYEADGSTSIRNRWAHYEIRIPAKRFDEFMTLAGDLGNVTSSGRVAENVTSQYTDYEARLSSLRTQEERLLKMLEESGDLESLIELEARLSEVRYEIESIERNLRNLDQRLAFSTVTLEIQEVEIYTPTAHVQRTFGEKLADAFKDGFHGFVWGCQSLTLFVVRNLITLVVLTVIVVVVVLLVKKTKAKKRSKKMQQPPTPPTDNQPK